MKKCCAKSFSPRRPAAHRGGDAKTSRLTLPLSFDRFALRRLLTPEATYSPEERDLFYRALAFTGQRLVEHGVTVLFDATASRQIYRDLARSMIPSFFEVAVECPLEVCMQRDRKGTYQKGLRSESTTVPGLQTVYESPANPDVRIDTTKVSAQEAATQISDMVRKRLADT